MGGVRGVVKGTEGCVCVSVELARPTLHTYKHTHMYAVSLSTGSIESTDAGCVCLYNAPSKQFGLCMHVLHARTACSTESTDMG